MATEIANTRQGIGWGKIQLLHDILVTSKKQHCSFRLH